MTAPVVADCTGLWRRTLLVDADGSHDTTTGVQWLQGISAYVDSRGFAGRLQQVGNVFQWHRDVDLEPPAPFPDAGSMHWDGATLVETGVHADYVEHWLREDAERVPCWALHLVSDDGGAGLLMRVGDLFGWAHGAAVVIGPTDGPRWHHLAVAVTGDRVRADGATWRIETSEGDVKT